MRKIRIKNFYTVLVKILLKIINIYRETVECDIVKILTQINYTLN